jgi:hypothetical protein
MVTVDKHTSGEITDPDRLSWRGSSDSNLVRQTSLTLSLRAIRQLHWKAKVGAKHTRGLGVFTWMKVQIQTKAGQRLEYCHSGCENRRLQD